MHVVVAIPPVHDFYVTPHRCSSLGALILKQRLQASGCTVTLYNFLTHKKKAAKINLPEPLHYLQPFLIKNETGKVSYFTQYHSFGLSVNECAETIVQEKPAICFISCFAFSYALQTIALAEAIKKLSPEILIVAGGAGPSVYPEYFIRNPSFDYVITGEAEVSVASFISCVNADDPHPEAVPNLYWKKGTQVVTPVFRTLSDTRSIDVVFAKTGENKNTVFLTTSVTRGCDKSCGFCSNHLTHGRNFRTAPLETVEKALKKYLRESGTDCEKRACINFEDDNLLIDSAYFLTLMKMCSTYFSEVSYIAENGIDYRMLTPESVDILIDAGMSKFNLSLASASAHSLAGQNRYLNLNHYHDVVCAITRRNIPCITYFICGFENDTINSIAETLHFLWKQPITIGISLFYAVPGISGFENRAVFDAVSPCCCNGSSAYPWNKSLSVSTLITSFRLSRYINLVKQENHTDSERELLQNIATEQRLFTLITTQSGVEIIPVPGMDRELQKMFFESLQNNKV